MNAHRLGKCPTCGHQLSVSALICPNCGERTLHEFANGEGKWGLPIRSLVNSQIINEVITYDEFFSICEYLRRNWYKED
jgi:predicted amidophosphoribosyltransferase